MKKRIIMGLQRLVLISCVLSHISPSFSSSYLISEVYGNSVGNSRDSGKEWIELANISGEKIEIRKLKIWGYGTDRQTVVFADDISLNQPIEFDDFVLIAQEDKLGLDRCLKKEIKRIVLPGFSIGNKNDQTICVSLNDEPEECARFLRKNRFDEGVSLYRDQNDLSFRPLWRKETCYLFDGIFASPGRPAFFCANHKDAQALIFQACEQKNNVIFDYELMRSKPFDTHPNQKEYLLAKDLFEAEKKADIFPAERARSMARAVPWSAKIADLKVISTMVSLTLNLAPSDMPINLMLIDSRQRILGQRSLVISGVRKIEFVLDRPMTELALVFSGISGNIEIPL